MSTLTKALTAAAGNAGGDGANVEDVFSTYLYEGNGNAVDSNGDNVITNGVDILGEGGLVWLKSRQDNDSNFLFDTERGFNLQPNNQPKHVARQVVTDTTTAESDQQGYGLTSFNSDGFNVAGTANQINATGHDYTSWTFRKAPRFFDVVTYTGNGTASREIAHDLGVAPGMMIVKRLDSASQWAVYHRSIPTCMSVLNSTANSYCGTGNGSFGDSSYTNIAPTDSVFTVGSGTEVNGSSATYVAYIFAHDPDGENDDGMIACGSYTGNGSDDGPDINLGWEAQYVLLKRSNSYSGWNILDTMRGMTVGEDKYFEANSSGAELGATAVRPTPNGFKLQLNSPQWNGSGDTFIYMAIRAPMMKEPESATEVFAIDTRNSVSTNPPLFLSGFPVDLAMQRNTGNGQTTNIYDRLRGAYKLPSHATNAESSNPIAEMDYSDGWNSETGMSANTSTLSYMFKRAKGFFDVVAYSGGGTTVKHSLGVVPEMLIIKNRTGTGRNWWVAHKHMNGGTDWWDYNMFLNLTNAEVADGGGSAFTSEPTSDEFALLYGKGESNASGVNYIAYLFATLAGVSKVGSYTGTSAAHTVDCGFSNGARFVLIKGTNHGSNWMLFDSTRGITSGNDALLQLNETEAESSANYLDPHSSGFAFTSSSAGSTNLSGREYIFLAIA
jgi:hypothetical protein